MDRARGAYLFSNKVRVQVRVQGVCVVEEAWINSVDLLLVVLQT